MKSVIFAVASLATAVVGQSIGDLAQCGQTCANNMLSAEKATELGCDTGDLACLCANENFIYGLRDCSAAICSSEDASKVVQYGIAACKSAGVAITTSKGSGSGSSTTATGNSKGTSATVSTIYSTITSDGSTITTAVSTTTFGSGDDDKSSKTASGSKDSGKVSTFTRVITNSDGDAVTTVGETTIGGSKSGVVVTTYTSDGSTIVSTITGSGADKTNSGSEATGTSGSDSDSSATATGSSSASGTDSSDSANESSSSSSSDNAALPQMTAAPVGVIAAAGLAFLLL